MIKTKSGARKIEGTDNWREIFDDHNYTVDALDQLADDMAIIVNGNKTAYASGAAVGQYVLLRNSTITDRADGMYKAAKAIPYNTTIDKTYLTAVSGGAINSLSDQIASKQDKGSSVTGSTLDTIESSLNTIANSMTDVSCVIGYAYPENWGFGSGCYVLSRRSSAIRNVAFILATAVVSGYYYSNVWHWYKVEMDAI